MNHSLVTLPRQLAFLILREIDHRSAYTDVALDRILRQHSHSLTSLDRALVTELVYGIMRRQRSLDTLIDQLGKKSSHQQPPNLRRILHLGLYQLRYLNHIPPSAAVNTSVELAKENGFSRLKGVVNGILRQYLRLAQDGTDPLILPSDSVQRLGIGYSFPDWIIQQWLKQWGETETEELCEWFNQPPSIDLRINPLKTTLGALEDAFTEANIAFSRLPYLPQALRLSGKRPIKQLPGFAEGWWTVQDASAQLVSYLLDPQPNDVIIDACAAPGGKTTHIAELMGDQGIIYACDRAPSRLRKLQANTERLQLDAIVPKIGDSCQMSEFKGIADKVLLDAPCSGLGTLHRHPDIRWRQTPEKIAALIPLQQALLENVATWVKPQGELVYATCTLNPAENEQIIEEFLRKNCHWQIVSPPSFLSPLTVDSGWIYCLPHHHQTDGFFMVKLKFNEL